VLAYMWAYPEGPSGKGMPSRRRGEYLIYYNDSGVQ